jgi:hypothetical protein
MMRYIVVGVKWLQKYISVPLVDQTSTTIWSPTLRSGLVISTVPIGTLFFIWQIFVTWQQNKRSEIHTKDFCEKNALQQSHQILRILYGNYHI